jgi:hypothetical protein
MSMGQFQKFFKQKEGFCFSLIILQPSIWHLIHVKLHKLRREYLGERKESEGIGKLEGCWFPYQKRDKIKLSPFSNIIKTAP